MNQMTAQVWNTEAELEALRQKIEEKRIQLNNSIAQREDLLGLEQQTLSQELDCLIGQYEEMQERELPYA